jgi:hypothetical protein
MKNPLLSLFVRLTAIVALGIVVLLVGFFVIKILLIAAIIAAIAVGGILIYGFFRRRANFPAIR